MTEPAEDEVIVLRDVTRVYCATRGHAAVHALNGVFLRVVRGTVVSVRGDSGSGKSTLLSLIGGLDLPDSGSILVDGQELTTLSEKELVTYRATKVGFVFQSYYLVPSLTALENVELALEPLGLSPSDRAERAWEALRAVGMRRRAFFRPGELSGGEQQRVGIARAIAKKPLLLLADEPTGNLDPKRRNAVLDFLFRVARDSNTTTIIVTHDPSISEKCDVDHKLKNGKISKTMSRLAKRRGEGRGALAAPEISDASGAPKAPSASSSGSLASALSS
jgi:putative ABC transport system ATP-binding protein